MKRICIVAVILALCFGFAFSVQAHSAVAPKAEGVEIAAYGSYVDPYDDYYIYETTNYGSYQDYDSNEGSSNILLNLGICLAIGFLIALIITGIMRGQLKSVRHQSGASDYVKAGSLNITNRQDLFLYREIRKVEKPRNNDGPNRPHSGRF